MSTVNIVLKTAIDYLEQINPAFVASYSKQVLLDKLQIALDSVLPGELSLDSASPDYESIYLSLTQALQTDDVWIDIIPSATGQTLLRNIASGINLASYAAERALQEAFPHSAHSPNSVFAASRMLGARITRRKPGQVVVRLTRQDNSTIVTIPRFTPFMVGDIRFFNRLPITFNVWDVSLDVTLYQGTLVTLDAISEGIPFERVEIGSQNGMISDEDVYVFVDGVEYTRVLDGMWSFKAEETVFYEATLPNTSVEICFGNRVFGAIPSSGSKVSILWAETDGVDANNTQDGIQVTVVSDIGIRLEGITVSPITNGTEAVPFGFYKVMAPHIHAANKRAVRRSDYRACALGYPGVVDAVFRGQAELNPGKRNWMNVIGATLLIEDGAIWSNSQWNTFVSWMRDVHAIYQCEFLRMDPTPLSIDITANVFCNKVANLTDVKAKLYKDIQTKFKPRLNSLGFSFYKTDIANLIVGKQNDELRDLIEYATDIVPSADVLTTGPLQWVKLNSLNLTVDYTTRNGYTGRLDFVPT